MNGHLSPTENLLIECLEESARGPKRNGVFALWLFTRYCDGLLPPHGLSDRANRRRLEGLRRRLTSLSLPPPLRRALSASLRELEAGTADAASLVLRQLVAPVREVLGAETAESMSWAAEQAKAATAQAETE